MPLPVCTESRNEELVDVRIAEVAFLFRTLIMGYVSILPHHLVHHRSKSVILFRHGRPVQFARFTVRLGLLVALQGLEIGSREGFQRLGKTKIVGPEKPSPKKPLRVVQRCAVRASSSPKIYWGGGSGRTQFK